MSNLVGCPLKIMDSDHCILVLIVTQIQFQLESFSYVIHDANMYCKSFWINIKLYYFFTTERGNEFNILLRIYLAVYPLTYSVSHHRGR